MQKLSPQICALWDGHNIWLQWTPADAWLPEAPVDDPAYAVRIALRRNESDVWEDWTNISAPSPITKCFRVIPVWREGWQVKAQVALIAPGELQWEQAQEVTFSRCTARFRFTSENSIFRADKGKKIGGSLDGAACVYQTTEFVEASPGHPFETTLEAVQLTGWAQLDHPGHLLVRPRVGVEITNIAPSENDTTPTGRNFSVLARAQPGGAFCIVKK